MKEDLKLITGWLGSLPSTLEVLYLKMLTERTPDSLALSVPFAHFPKLRVGSEIPLPFVYGDQPETRAICHRLEAAPRWQRDRFFTPREQDEPTDESPRWMLELAEMKAYLTALPALKSLHWWHDNTIIEFGSGWSERACAIISEFGPNIKRLFLNFNDVDVCERDAENRVSSIWEGFRCLGGQLEELVVILDTWKVLGKDIVVQHGGDDPPLLEQIEVLKSVLPTTLVLVCDVMDEWIDNDYGQSFEMEQYFLPELLESWEAHPLLINSRQPELKGSRRSAAAMQQMLEDRSNEYRLNARAMYQFRAQKQGRTDAGVQGPTLQDILGWSMIPPGKDGNEP